MRIPAIVFVSAALVACSESLSSLSVSSDDLPLTEQPLSSRPAARRVAALDRSLVVV